MNAMGNGSFDKIGVLLNTANPMEIGWMDDYANIKARIWAGFPDSLASQRSRRS